MLIPRAILPELKLLLGEYAVVTILGPRQAGKTTLVREFLPGYAYCNLEDPETRELAARDPKSLLGRFKGPVILDEIQRVPLLLSHIQVLVDEERTAGRFILTGSHQLRLREAVAQSLAGRTAILTLLPLSMQEMEKAGIRFDTFDEYVYRGFLPRIHDRKLRPSTAYANYYQTYIERDVRQLIQLKDASAFEKLMKLLAGRAGQLVDYSSLANDVGVDAKTVKHWLSILEASFVLYKLPPYFENFGKRAIKSPKYYFTEVGLLAYLLGLREPAHVARDPLVGAMFENLVVMECVKELANRGEIPELYFFRDNHGNEVDLLYRSGRRLHAAEIKSGATIAGDMLRNLDRLGSTTDRVARSLLIYAGSAKPAGNGIEAVPYSGAGRLVAPPPRR